MRRLPMFPLGSVLFPGMVLPLHVFEPRYRALTTDVLAGDREFGVTLIERGSEVGGGDVRADLGTVARVVEAEELGDGRWVLVSVGVTRLRVVEWLPDDPYPRAVVEELEEPPVGSADEARVADLTSRLRTVLALATELGEPAVPVTTSLAEDPRMAAYQAAAYAGATPLDAQRVLAADSAATRLDVAEEILDGAEAARRFRLRAGGEPDTDDG